ncbi:helix-turn-helix transcriptional regulator [Rhizobium sp. L1K21]|uniref:helix-turn-helix transcriptional regulator n=1 Tax=Rhizobium sp. L1K21 TaxID=2954933 RepID=UPI0027953341|nr:helix-turn-helix transcriptional regulator [Rhizobium sp. L1K21]
MKTARLSESFLERELGRAQSKTDFFRAFKMHADYYGLRSFVLLEVERLRDGARLGDFISLSKLPAQSRDVLDAAQFSLQDAFLRELTALKRPKIWTEATCGQYCVLLAGARVMGIPHLTNAGSRYCVLLGDGSGDRDGEQLSDIIYDFSNITRRYCDFAGLNSDTPSFSKREREVTEWTSEGKTTAEIAIILGLSEYTVNEYIATAMRKVDAVSRGHLVAKAIRLGIID